MVVVMGTSDDDGSAMICRLPECKMTFGAEH